MEEQPGQQHHHHHHHHHHHVQHSQSAHSHYYYYSHTQHPSAPNVQHGAEGSAKHQPKPLKHDHKHALQHQETHQKKTDNGELNGSLGERHIPPKILVSGKVASQAASGVPNGSQQVADTNTKQLAKAHNFSKAGSKPKTLLHKNSMDRKNEKSYESKVKESKSPDKGEAGYIQNGVFSNSAGYITNGYVNKTAENDGSGSENGYATPKKRKARCSVSKAVEDPNIVIDKMMDIDGKLESDSLVDQKGGARVDNAKASWKCEAAGRAKPSSGDIQRKNSDAKPVTAKKFDDRPKGKTSTAVSSKEDSWTLFKPPPVFPVDNSSAKIVPKISYASKVKENLNKAAQNNSASQSSLAFTPQAGDIQPLNCVSQVPMSAMKSVSTVNFANGPLLVGTDGGFLATAASTVPHSLPGGAEPLLAESASVPNFSEQKKTGLFTYPSNMQHTLPDTIQRDMSGQSNQHSLGEIFQNQWGLSFINEPSAGPEAGSDKPAHGQVVWEPPNQLVSQGADVAASGNERPAFPKAYELEKRTSAQVPDGVPLKAAHGSGAEGTVLSSDPKDYGELQNADSASQGTLVFQSKVFEIDVPQTSLKNTLQTSAKDKRFHGGVDCKDSWSSFDLRAAILYHTKESSEYSDKATEIMQNKKAVIQTSISLPPSANIPPVSEVESVLSLQKQDPSRIITYNEAMDLPDH